jgi:hypothetical protein
MAGAGEEDSLVVVIDSKDGTRSQQLIKLWNKAGPGTRPESECVIGNKEYVNALRYTLGEENPDEIISMSIDDLDTAHEQFEKLCDQHFRHILSKAQRVKSRQITDPDSDAELDHEDGSSDEEPTVPDEDVDAQQEMAAPDVEEEEQQEQDGGEEEQDGGEEEQDVETPSDAPRMKPRGRCRQCVKRHRGCVVTDATSACTECIRRGDKCSLVPSAKAANHSVSEADADSGADSDFQPDESAKQSAARCGAARTRQQWISWPDIISEMLALARGGDSKLTVDWNLASFAGVDTTYAWSTREHIMEWIARARGYEVERSGSDWVDEVMDAFDNYGLTQWLWRAKERAPTEQQQRRGSKRPASEKKSKKKDKRMSKKARAEIDELIAATSSQRNREPAFDLLFTSGCQEAAGYPESAE